MRPVGIAADIVLILVAGLLGGLLAHFLRQPLLVGYILAGVLVGPHSVGPSVVEVHHIELLAEIGVALLLFALGLELSLRDLRPVRRIALVGGPLQILLTAAIGYMVGRTALGWDHDPALWLGAMFSLSSTMVVIKTLNEQGAMRRLGSRVIIGLLVVQDLALAPLLILLPKFGDLRSALPDLVQAVLQGAVFLVAMVLVGTKVIPALLRKVAGWHSRELFLVAVVVLGVGVGYGTYLLGLSFALGAFVAGIVLSESEFSHQALNEIVPLRDVFGLIFFASAGMLLDVRFLWEHVGLLIGLVALVLCVKALLVGSLVRIFGYTGIVPWAAGLGLAQVGEFSFVLARAGLGAGSLDGDEYALALSVTLATMVLSPALARMAGALHGAWRRLLPPATAAPEAPQPVEDLGGHVVVAGLGRSGKAAVQCMRQVGLPFVIVDLSHRRVEDARNEGLEAIWGDASREVVLEAAGVQRARLLLLALPDAVGTRLAVEEARKLNPSLHVVARAVSQEHVAELGDIGVYEAVQAQFEAGLELVRQVLVHYSIPTHEILHFCEVVRGEHYEPLRPGPLSHRYMELASHLKESGAAVELDWVTVPPSSAAVGQSLGQVNLRVASGALVVAILRGGNMTQNPPSDWKLEPEDMLAVCGTHAQRAAARALVERPGEAARGGGV